MSSTLATVAVEASGSGLSHTVTAVYLGELYTPVSSLVQVRNAKQQKVDVTTSGIPRSRVARRTT